MKYTTYRYWFKYGNEDDPIECTDKEWDNLDKAISYAHRYATGVRFAGVEIEDENGKIVYRITTDSIVEDYREQLTEDKKEEMVEKLEEMSVDNAMKIVVSEKRVVMIDKEDNKYRVTAKVRTTPQGKWKLSFILPRGKLENPKKIIEYIFTRYGLNFQVVYTIR